MSTNEPREDGAAERGPGDDEPLFDERITGYPWLAGILTGTWTFAAGYVLMVLVIVGSGGVQGSLFDTLPAVLEDAGITFYNAQNVPIDIDPVEQNIANPEVLPDVLNVLSGETRIPKVVYYAVPVVALAAAGALLTWWTLPEDATLADAVLPPTAITVGYMAFAVLGTFVLRPARADADGVVVARLAPDLVQTVVFSLLYGFLIPLLAAVLVVAYWNRGDLTRMTAR